MTIVQSTFQKNGRPEGRPTNSVYQMQVISVNSYLCIRLCFSVLHDWKLFTLYNIPTWNSKLLVLDYCYKEKSLTAILEWPQKAGKHRMQIMWKPASFMWWTWTMHRKLAEHMQQKDGRQKAMDVSITEWKKVEREHFRRTKQRSFSKLDGI